MRVLRGICCGLGLAALGVSSTPAAFAQVSDFPTGVVKILVPFPAGGPADVIMRVLGDRLSARWGKPVVIDNRPGAATITATAALARSQPDGHTMGVATNFFVVNPALNRNLPYDTLKDFAGVSMVATQPIVIVANPSFPANTIAELIAEARKGSLDYTSSGPRGAGHMAGELLQSVAGIKMQHIAYNGSPPALADVIAGRIPVMFEVWHSAKPHVEAGKLKVIAVASPQRMRDAQQYPAVAETFPEFSAIAFQALVAPAGVPAPVMEKLSSDIRAIIASAEFGEKMRPLGVDPGGTTPAELDRLLRQETEKWADIAKKANIKVD